MSLVVPLTVGPSLVSLSLNATPSPDPHATPIRIVRVAVPRPGDDRVASPGESAEKGLSPHGPRLDRPISTVRGNRRSEVREPVPGFGSLSRSIRACGRVSSNDRLRRCARRLTSSGVATSGRSRTSYGVSDALPLGEHGSLRTDGYAEAREQVEDRRKRRHPITEFRRSPLDVVALTAAVRQQASWFTRDGLAVLTPRHPQQVVTNPISVSHQSARPHQPSSEAAVQQSNHGARNCPLLPPTHS